MILRVKVKLKEKVMLKYLKPKVKVKEKVQSIFIVADENDPKSKTKSKSERRSWIKM